MNTLPWNWVNYASKAFCEEDLWEEIYCSFSCFLFLSFSFRKSLILLRASLISGVHLQAGRPTRVTYTSVAHATSFRLLSEWNSINSKEPQPSPRRSRLRGGFRITRLPKRKNPPMISKGWVSIGRAPSRLSRCLFTLASCSHSHLLAFPIPRWASRFNPLGLGPEPTPYIYRLSLLEGVMAPFKHKSFSLKPWNLFPCDRKDGRCLNVSSSFSFTWMTGVGYIIP